MVELYWPGLKLFKGQVQCGNRCKTVGFHYIFNFERYFIVKDQLCNPIIQSSIFLTITKCRERLRVRAICWQLDPGCHNSPKSPTTTYKKEGHTETTPLLVTINARRDHRHSRSKNSGECQEDAHGSQRVSKQSIYAAHLAWALSWLIT